tara:strand:- start:370 stop:603 length:234 start_codon:yes stop_codon:yes gene_type:complete
MAETKNFRIEYGLNTGATEVITSGGKITASAVSNLDTADIAENASKLYFSTTRVSNHLSDSSTQKTINNALIDGGTF